MIIGAVAAGLPDGPSVVLVHGLGGSHHTWDRVVPVIDLATAFAPGTQIPDQFIADLRTTVRHNLVASSRAIDTYLAEAPLADRLAALGGPVDLTLGEHDQRVARPLQLVSDGHTPPCEAPELILTAVHGQAEPTRELETL